MHSFFLSVFTDIYLLRSIIACSPFFRSHLETERLKNRFKSFVSLDWASEIIKSIFRFVVTDYLNFRSRMYFLSVTKTQLSATTLCIWAYPAVRTTLTAAPTFPPASSSSVAPRKPCGSPLSSPPPSSHRMVPSKHFIITHPHGFSRWLMANFF